MTNMGDPELRSPGDIHVRPLAARAARLGVILIRLAGDALLIDAAYETWRAGSPVRLTVVLAVAAFAALTLWVLSQGGRIGGRGWLTDPAAPFIVLLGLLVVVTGSRDEIARGVVMLGQRTDAVLTGALILLVGLAVLRFSGPGGVRTWWLRAVVAALGVYAAWSLAQAAAARATLVAVLAGDCAWRAVPVWLRGGHVGAFVLLPLAFIREFGVAMTRLTLAGLFRWMVIFALGTWIAIRVAGL
jgi:hypothetical protein